MASPRKRESSFCDKNQNNCVFRALYEQKQLCSFCDVIMKVCGKDIFAHSNVLAAASPYFQSFLGQELPRQFSQRAPQVIEIQIDGSEPNTHYQDAVTAVIDFVYTGKMDVNETSVNQISEIARIMQINSVIKFCESFLTGKENEFCGETTVDIGVNTNKSFFKTTQSQTLSDTQKVKTRHLVTVSTQVRPQLLGVVDPESQRIDKGTSTEGLARFPMIAHQSANLTLPSDNEQQNISLSDFEIQESHAEKDASSLFVTEKIVRKANPRGRKRKLSRNVIKHESKKPLIETNDDKCIFHADEKENNLLLNDKVVPSLPDSVKIKKEKCFDIASNESVLHEHDEQGGEMKPLLGRGRRTIKPTARLLDSTDVWQFLKTVDEKINTIYDSSLQADSTNIPKLPIDISPNDPVDRRVEKESSNVTTVLPDDTCGNKMDDILGAECSDKYKENLRESYGLEGMADIELDYSLNQTTADAEIDQVTSYKANKAEIIEVSPIKKKVTKTKVKIEADDTMVPLTGKYQCDTCEFTTNRVREMSNHKKLHKLALNVCYYCDTQFLDKDTLTIHMSKHKGPQPFFCPTCNGRFKTRTLLNLHLPKHSNDKPFICEVCSQGFKWKHALKNHMVTHSNKKEHLCDVCGYATAHKTQLKSHKLIHTGNTFKCTVENCLFQTTKKQNLKYHMLRHTREKPHKCDICSQSFSLVKNMKRHMLLHTSRKCHKCDDCDFASTRFDKLKEHLLKQHGIGTPPEKRLLVSTLIQPLVIQPTPPVSKVEGGCFVEDVAPVTDISTLDWKALPGDTLQKGNKTDIVSSEAFQQIHLIQNSGGNIYIASQPDGTETILHTPNLEVAISGEVQDASSKVTTDADLPVEETGEMTEVICTGEEYETVQYTEVLIPTSQMASLVQLSGSTYNAP